MTFWKLWYLGILYKHPEKYVNNISYPAFVQNEVLVNIKIM